MPRSGSGPDAVFIATRRGCAKGRDVEHHQIRVTGVKRLRVQAASHEGWEREVADDHIGPRRELSRQLLTFFSP